jgi:diphthine methyl ester synthase
MVRTVVCTTGMIVVTHPPVFIPVVFGPHTLCVAVARLGQDDQRIVCATLVQMAATASAEPAARDDGEGEEVETEGADIIDMGPPLHSLVLVGDTHPLEMEVLRELHMWQP